MTDGITHNSYMLMRENLIRLQDESVKLKASLTEAVKVMGFTEGLLHMESPSFNADVFDRMKFSIWLNDTIAECKKSVKSKDNSVTPVTPAGGQS